MGVFKRSHQKFTGYDEWYHDYYWQDLNRDQKRAKYENEFNNYAFDCRASVDYRIHLFDIIHFNVGLSYYYAQNGITRHHRIYGNAGFHLKTVQEKTKSSMPSKNEL